MCRLCFNLYGKKKFDNINLVTFILCTCNVDYQVKIHIKMRNNYIYST